MLVNPYAESLLRNANDLLNSPPGTPGDLESRWESHGMPSPGAVDAKELRRTLLFLNDWERVVSTSTDDERVTILNDMLKRFAAPPSITRHDGSRWHLHYRDANATFSATLAGATTAAAAHYLTERGLHRIGRCRLAECTRAFADFTRPGTQRYCTAECANRDAVRRHRARARLR